MNRNKRKIIVFTDYYLPGFLAGGPIRSVSYLINSLKNQFDFLVITRDHDFTLTEPYVDITPNTMIHQAGVDILYLSDKKRLLARLFNCIKKFRLEPFSIFYFNSFFSFWFSILPIFMIKRVFFLKNPIILAPRGEFSKGALSLKSFKKNIYITLSKIFRLYHSVVWHATSLKEFSDIESIVGKSAKIVLAENIGINPEGYLNVSLSKKTFGKLKIIFLSRISRKKNLDYALKVLSLVSSTIEFDIYGPKEDMEYWKYCENLIQQLPENIQARYCGVVSPLELASVFSQYNLFFFPTQGENFGHVILEALTSGCPVLLSDTTPWQGLELSEAGWVYSLSNPIDFAQKIEDIAALTPEEHENWVQGAIAFAHRYCVTTPTIENHRKLFENVSNRK